MSAVTIASCQASPRAHSVLRMVVAISGIDIEHHISKHLEDFRSITSHHMGQLEKLLIVHTRLTMAGIQQAACRVHVEPASRCPVKTLCREKPLSFPGLNNCVSAIVSPAATAMSA